MKLSAVFNIIIKVFGFIIIKDIFATLPYLIMPVISLTDIDIQFKWGSLIVSLLIMALYFSIAYTLIFKTESMVAYLKLEPELSDEYLTFNVSAVNVLTIALIILSGYILIDEIPNFCNYLFNYYEQSQLKFQATKPSISKILVSAIKIIIAFLIIGERKRIIQIIQKDEPAYEDELIQEDTN